MGNRDHYPWGDLESYVRAAADLVGLKDWTIRIDRSNPEDENADAENFVPKGRILQTISFADSFFEERTAEEQRQVVLHELMHAHLDIVRQAIHILEPECSQATWQTWWRAVDWMIERVVDSTAAALAPGLPVPDLPRSAASE